ncbi:MULTISPECIES: ribbon-helix-helix domain-containing protein [Thalassospira]|uniref:Ribbon-helix-helix protein, CopG family n=2 Tax=Thalassospira TaxID=168934 RepID=A0A358HVI6_9PROT|nr:MULTISPECIES: ribbon-helix-helix protein, CopG family [Thalassospira]PKR57220.1 type II toxin-antitoxin system ParD family antitoxin [Thalassospira lohafexi]HBU99002.1 ribbon-helix-helix protein, CopG family [Thalassospira lucentensis]HCW69188.1 ribbon-helix-helix protein, CopG family [Thalassospira lucentensis]|tara:strand:+ start:1306 stop:1599 length:294 start_codon:yes stop_codon:yes gene_type:complete
MGTNNTIERMTVTVTQEMAHTMRSAMREGGYASSSEIIREALRDWQHKRKLKQSELDALRADIAVADQDIAEDRVSSFNAETILQRGQEKLNVRSRS